MGQPQGSVTQLRNWALSKQAYKIFIWQHCLPDSHDAEGLSREPECLPGAVPQQQAALGKPKCQAGGDCARTRAALNWPDHLPCVDPSKVSVPVDKSIALLKWFESLGHSVPELRELEAIKRRQAPESAFHASARAQDSFTRMQCQPGAPCLLNKSLILTQNCGSGSLPGCRGPVSLLLVALLALRRCSAQWALPHYAGQPDAQREAARGLPRGPV